MKKLQPVRGTRDILEEYCLELGSTLSLRAVIRLGSKISVHEYNTTRFGSNLSILDCYI